MRQVAIGIYRTPAVCGRRWCQQITFEISGLCRMHEPTATSASGPMYPPSRQGRPPMPKPGKAQRSKNSDGEGRVRSEWWKIAGDLSRSEGPAHLRFHENGEIAFEEWRVHGVLSRIGGPATAYHSIGGAIGSPRFFVGGYEYSREEYFRALSELSENHLYEGLYPAGWSEVLDRGGAPKRLLVAIEADLRTPEGIDAVAVDGAPVEWARAFENAS